MTANETTAEISVKMTGREYWGNLRALDAQTAAQSFFDFLCNEAEGASSFISDVQKSYDRKKYEIICTGKASLSHRSITTMGRWVEKDLNTFDGLNFLLRVCGFTLLVEQDEIGWVNPLRLLSNEYREDRERREAENQCRKEESVTLFMSTFSKLIQNHEVAEKIL